MLKLYLATDNAAFRDDPTEIARLLREAAGTLLPMPDRIVCGRMRDANGNIVGRWIFEPEEEYVSDVCE